jgi:hypothetical protein
MAHKGQTVSSDPTLKTDLARIMDRMVKARLQAQSARTTQERQHLEGMANYWEELLRDAEALALDPS